MKIFPKIFKIAYFSRIAGEAAKHFSSSGGEDSDHFSPHALRGRHFIFVTSQSYFGLTLATADAHTLRALPRFQNVRGLGGVKFYARVVEPRVALATLVPIDERATGPNGPFSTMALATNLVAWLFAAFVQTLLLRVVHLVAEHLQQCFRLIDAKAAVREPHITMIDRVCPIKRTPPLFYRQAKKNGRKKPAQERRQSSRIIANHRKSSDHRVTSYPMLLVFRRLLVKRDN